MVQAMLIQATCHGLHLPLSFLLLRLGCIELPALFAMYIWNYDYQVRRDSHCTDIMLAIAPPHSQSGKSGGRIISVQKLNYDTFNCSNSMLAKTNAANPLRSFRSVETPT